MAKVTFKLVWDDEWEEYQVQCIEDGIVNKDKTYHTDNEDDALSALQAMKEELEIQQHERLDQTGDGLNIPQIGS